MSRGAVKQSSGCFRHLYCTVNGQDIASMSHLSLAHVQYAWVKGSRSQIWCGQEVKTDFGQSRILTPVPASYMYSAYICNPPSQSLVLWMWVYIVWHAGYSAFLNAGKSCAFFFCLVWLVSVCGCIRKKGVAAILEIFYDPLPLSYVQVCIWVAVLLTIILCTLIATCFIFFLLSVRCLLLSRKNNNSQSSVRHFRPSFLHEHAECAKSRKLMAGIFLFQYHSPVMVVFCSTICYNAETILL